MGLHVYEALVAQRVAEAHWGGAAMKWGFWDTPAAALW